MNRQSRLMLVAVSVATAALSTGAASAQSAPSTDGTYKGAMVCPLPEGRVLRAPLDLTIANNAAQFSRPIFDGNGRVLGTEMGNGSVEGTTLRLKSSGTSERARYEGTYSGEITGDGGTLTGSQSWTVATETQTRPCTVAFIKLRL